MTTSNGLGGIDKNTFIEQHNEIIRLHQKIETLEANAKKAEKQIESLKKELMYASIASGPTG